MHRDICVKGLSGTTAPRILKFGVNIGYNYLYCVRQNQHRLAYHSLSICSLILFIYFYFFIYYYYYYFFFFFFFFFFVKDFSGSIAPRI